MYNKLTQMLHLKIEPVGVFFGNTAAECDLDAAADKRNCVMPFLMAAAKGKMISMNEESCNCAGGAVGCCFGDGFSRINPNIQTLLSQGLGENAPEGTPDMLKEGERFFCDEDIALKWRKSIPYSDRAYPRIVFAPLTRWEEIGKPDLVLVFANPDQISALVTMLSFHNGKALNAIAPFGAACQSILHAAQQMDQEEPFAIMGLFDVSQRTSAWENYLSLTMPYQMWEQFSVDLDKSCLTSHSWRKIEARLN